MYGDDSYAATALGEVVTVGVPITPEVAVEGKELIFVLEVEMLELGA